MEEVLAGKGKWMLSEFWRTFEIRRKGRREEGRSGERWEVEARQEKEGQRGEIKKRVRMEEVREEKKGRRWEYKAKVTYK